MPFSNISIFVPHQGCPNDCSFCNQKSITGVVNPPTATEVRETCLEALSYVEDKNSTQIAFFGGSFTAIKQDYMISLLETANEFIGEGKFQGIRISTRPDKITEEILVILKKYNVKSIELGVQSMDDYVLFENDRGHSEQDVFNAVKLIKKYNFELTLQMMVGLFKSDKEKDLFTAEKIIGLKPNNVRIYPVAILENTKLGELYKSGEYVPYSLEFGVEICCELIKKFAENNIPIIKLGLHASEVVEKDLLGGLYHPAFRELCESKIYFDRIYAELAEFETGKYIVFVNEKNLSKAIGQKKSNITKLLEFGFDVKIKADKKIKNDKIKVIKEGDYCI